MVYSLKEGGKKRYNDILVVNGFAQKNGIDFDEIVFNKILSQTHISLNLEEVPLEWSKKLANGSLAAKLGYRVMSAEI